MVRAHIQTQLPHSGVNPQSFRRSGLDASHSLNANPLPSEMIGNTEVGGASGSKPVDKERDSHPSTNVNANGQRQMEVEENRREIEIEDFSIEPNRDRNDGSHMIPAERGPADLASFGQAYVEGQLAHSMDEGEHNPSEDTQSLSRSSTKGKKSPTEYAKFYSFYYDLLKKEHPKWNSQQITTIVSLQWKKRKMIQKQPSKPSKDHPLSQRKSTKPISGKSAYRLSQKGSMQEEEISETWNKLPFQSKQYWKRVGNNSASKSTTTAADNNEKISETRSVEGESHNFSMKAEHSKQETEKVEELVAGQRKKVILSSNPVSSQEGDSMISRASQGNPLMRFLLSSI